MALPVLLLPLLAIGLFSFAVAYTSHYRASGELDFWKKVLGNIPVFGPVIQLLAGSVTLFTQTVSNWAGKAVASVDAPFGTAFHELARIVNKVGQTITQLGAFALTVARLVTQGATHSDISRALRGIRSEVKTAEHTATAAAKTATTAEKIARHSVAQGVLPRLKRVENDVGKTIPKEIKTARDLAQNAESKASAAWGLVKSKPWEIGAAAFAGAVSIALDTLGGTGIKCNGFRNLFKKRGCGTWSGLDGLLTLFEATFVVSAVCDVIPLLEGYVSDIAVPVVVGLTDVGAGLCKGSIGPASSLSGPSIGDVTTYI